MSDLTAEQIYEACAGFNFMSDKMDGHRYVVIERAALPYADALAEGRVLSSLQGERRIVLTTVDGKWPILDAALALYEWDMYERDQGPNAPTWDTETAGWYARGVSAVLDALAGEGT